MTKIEVFSLTADRLGFLFWIFGWVFGGIFHGRLEIADAFAEAFAEIGEFAGPEQEQSNAHDQQNVHRLEQTFHGFLLGPERILGL
jgi:hypothetical protein